MNKDYYIFSNGRLKRKENTVYFEDTEGNLKLLPVETVEKIHIFGEVDLNNKFLSFISSYGTIINFYNYYGFYMGSFYPRKKNVSGFLLVKQAEYYSKDEKRLYLAKCFVESASFHILRNLREYKNTEGEIERINKEKENIYKAQGIDELMGTEGRIRKIYYEAFNKMLKNGFELSSREKRPPKDPVNAMISFGNMQMYTTVLGEIYKTQLDPTISYLHEPSTKRFSLSLDLAEIFKPLIVDPVIFKLINNRVITKEDFDYEEEFCFLNDNGKKKFIKEFEEKLHTTIKHRKLNRSVSYKGFIILECYKLIKHLLGDEIYKPLKAWW
ncbi:CRISPR-associated endonuclease Cas1 [Caloramator mitchellensis]|uniref:CRISPR-associated endonuclease Cas1 n=1 Tax=Caloramator mitchellensis TaxID=908809 RepID=A0A0R3K0T7_CALMK|nr:type I-B CRISPR-associated endonuclease Cas1b [Caloramator mitchellensis]KRQ85887.1 CRISPR-associated endonuclease Cas1 [Caloramator mitchellensis]